MKVKVFGFVLVVLFVVGCKGADNVLPDEKNRPPAKEALLAETFIQKNLLKEDGRMRTNITDRQDVYLSETVGLWMDYLVAKNDFVAFDKQVEMMETYILFQQVLIG